MKEQEGSDFIQNANVVKESLNTNASSLEYAKANILLGSKAITDYRRLLDEEAEVHGVKTVHHVFRARNSTTEPLLQYSQTYFSRDRVGYSVTCVSKDELSIPDSQSLINNEFKLFSRSRVMNKQGLIKKILRTPFPKTRW